MPINWWPRIGMLEAPDCVVLVNASSLPCSRHPYNSGDSLTRRDMSHRKINNHYVLWQLSPSDKTFLDR